MKSIWTYKLLPDLPAPPGEFIDKIDMNWTPPAEDINKYVLGQNTGVDSKYLAVSPDRKSITWYGRQHEGVTHRRIPLGKDWEQWVRENIHSEFSDTGISYANGDITRPTSTAHTDFTRNFTLIYLIDAGGPLAELAIWRAIGQPLLWDQHMNFSDNKNLINLAVLPGNPGMWYILNAKILHSVENLIRPRIGFQVSFINEPFKDAPASHECYTW